jgi:hypothetical protein
LNRLFFQTILKSTAKYGEFDPQCAEIYYYYGRALLELARVENTVLGNALNGVNTEETGPIDDSRYGNPEEIPRKLIFVERFLNDISTFFYFKFFFSFCFQSRREKGNLRQSH